MDKGYSAFGLALRSSFSLPGMAEVEAEEDSPPLDLNLDRAGGARGGMERLAFTGPWRGKLGDGNELAIAWGEDGDLLLDYSGGARFRLDPSGLASAVRRWIRPRLPGSGFC